MGEITTAALDLAKRVAQLHTYARIGYHKTLVAIANKHARLVWVSTSRCAHTRR